MERNTFDSIKIGLASPEMIRQWSHGEVTKSETINYRTQKPERDGLFCERIFGPTKDYECYCGRYRRSNGTTKNKRCEKCGVVLTRKKVRREWMGHIELACPVAHIWYSHHTPSRMATLLDISPKMLDKVIYYQAYIVTDPGDVNVTGLTKGQVLEDKEYNAYDLRHHGLFKAGMGAEAVKPLLQEMDLDALSAELKKQLEASGGQKKTHLIKRLEVVEAFRRSGNKPEWMILDVVPIMPPDLRTMVQLDGGRYATSDLNELYRKVIYVNNRLKKYLGTFAPKVIVNNEKRQLQDAVDALIDNGKHGRAITGSNNRTLKSLSEQLRGKQGRFRQNLLGKRVDYSGRSVIVVGPDLKIYQCGLPKEMALELFKPFVMKRLVETGKATNIKDAKKAVERVRNEVWDALEIVIKEHPVLLNRAPTLHRLSVQAFEPVLVEGRAIKLHPLVCKAFNADFDGDQMPVHVPLSVEAQAEARFLMLSANNLLKPADGKAVTVPSQDMVLGSYYLTISKPGEPGERPEGEELAFRDFNEAKMAYFNGIIGLHTPIRVRITKVIDGKEQSGIIRCTLGRLIFNQAIPQDLHYVDRSDPSKAFDLEIDYGKPGQKDLGCGSKMLGQIIDRCIKYNGFGETAIMLDKIKAMGFEYSTRASISISVADMIIPPEKYTLVEQAEKDVNKVAAHFARGELNEEERYNNVIKIWEQATDNVVNSLQSYLSRYNPIMMMADSGARGSMKQMRQLSGIRGLMFATNGKTMEIPIKSNFREGLNILEYFMAARGARKSLSDTALKTSNSGYLTRRLVDVAHEVIIYEEDCGTRDGLRVHSFRESPKGKEIEGVAERIAGRYIIGDVRNPETGELIAADNTMIDEATAAAIAALPDVENLDIRIRSPLKCRCKRGICAHCYGADLAHSKPVEVGEAVGVIAAQSIGEPGTQLTMRTFHTGGVAGSDITQGLPRVEELFEARTPKKAALASEYAGTVHIDEIKKTLRLSRDDGQPEAKPYSISYATHLTVTEGEHVEACQELSEGFLVPDDILRIKGIDAVYDYILQEVQKVYRQQNIEINDKHIEIITRQMTRKVHVDDAGSSSLTTGTDIFKPQLYDAIEEVQKRIDAGEEDLKLPEVTPILLGIKKAALQTESFLSAASFQETTKVLTDAAINGKIDYLHGLKENVIIGKLIPAGTGMERYGSLEVQNVNARPDPLMDELESAVGRIDTRVAYSSDISDDEDDEDDSELIGVTDDELTAVGMGEEAGDISELNTDEQVDEDDFS